VGECSVRSGRGGASGIQHGRQPNLYGGSLRHTGWRQWRGLAREGRPRRQVTSGRGGHQGAEPGARGEHAVIAVAVEPRGRQEGGEPAEELDRGEPDHGASVGCGPGQVIDDRPLLAPRPRGPCVPPFESLERERRPGAVSARTTRSTPQPWSTRLISGFWMFAKWTSVTGLTSSLWPLG